MLELAPGVYTAPRMSKAVRERVWAVLCQWHRELQRGSVVLTWADSAAPGGQAVATLGVPPKALCDCDGVFLAVRALGQMEAENEVFDNL